jgi:MFS family permease
MAQSVWEVWAAGVCCGLGHGYVFPILLGLFSKRAYATERGAAMAIYTTIDEGALLMAGPAFGFLIETMGYATMFGVASVLLAGATGVFFLWDRRYGEAPI